MAFKAIAQLADLYDGCRIAVRIDPYRLLLLQWQGSVYIIEDRCPHMDAPLASGALVSGNIVCRAHGIAFALHSGQAQGPLSDTLDCLRFFPVCYDGNRIGVDL